MEASLLDTKRPYLPFIESVTIEKLKEDAILPTYASEGDSGMDVYAPEDIEIRPGHNQIVKLGWKIGIPKHPFHDYGYRWEMQIRPKSGISARTDIIIRLGTVDNFYRDEVGVIVRNNFAPEYVLEKPDESERQYLEVKTTDYSRDLKGYPAIFRGNWYNNPVGTYLIRKGERFAQVVFAEVIRPLQIIEGTVSTEESRGGGFGSTGI